MASTFGLRAIPWAFIDHELMKVWIWRTEHFEVRITAEMNSFAWQVVDLVSAPDDAGVFLTEGRSRDFATAENEVREAVAKSYPPKYGYSAYAGPLATTFTLATGERVDLGVFTGLRAFVTVRFPDGSEHQYAGEPRVVHHELRLAQDSGQTIRIQPSHIVRVVAEQGLHRTDAKSAYTGMGRIYQGKMVAGCTGKPGFMPDTIDHAGPVCGIHEDASASR